MRRVLPLKAVSSSSLVNGGSNYVRGEQERDGGRSPGRRERNPRPKSGGSVSSRYVSPARRAKADEERGSSSSLSSSAEDRRLSNPRREHLCTGAENGARCDTPPSGDENSEGASEVVEKGVISSSGKSSLSSVGSRGSASIEDKEMLEGGRESVGSMRGAPNSGSTLVDKHPSKRSGPKALDNEMLGRAASTPIEARIKPKSLGTVGAAPPSPLRDEALRSISASRTRAPSRGADPGGAARVHSMRLTSLADRLTQSPPSPLPSPAAAAAAQSNGARSSPTSDLTSDLASDLTSDLSSSAENSTPRVTPPAANFEWQRQTHVLPVKSLSVNGSLGLGIAKPSALIVSSRKKEFGSAGAASPSAKPKLNPPAKNPFQALQQPQQRLGGSFRGGTKPASDGGMGLGLGDEKTALGHSKRMTFLDHHPQRALPAPSASPGRPDDEHSCCSEASTPDDKMTLAFAPSPRRVVDQPRSQSFRKTGRTPVIAAPDVAAEVDEKGGVDQRVLTWEEFVSGGKPSPPEEAKDARSESDLAAKKLGLYAGESGRRASAGVGEADEKKGAAWSSNGEEDERDILKAWIGEMRRQSEEGGLGGDDLETKARAAEQRLAALSGELRQAAQQQQHQAPAPSLVDEHLEFLEEVQVGREGGLAAGINVMQQRIRKVQEEKKRLAWEVAAEVKRRITERAAAKEVLVMMKREMEACVRVMEKEKLDLKAGVQREVERRRAKWFAQLEEARSGEEQRFREKLRSLEEEKAGLRSELDSVSSKEAGLRERVAEFERQMEGNRGRVEGAEQTIVDLRQSLVSSCKQARQAEIDLDALRKAYEEKESHSRELSAQVEKLRQQLGAGQEGAQKGPINGLKAPADVNGRTVDAVKRELIRAGAVEKSLREELRVLKSEVNSLHGDNKALAESLGNAKQEAERGGAFQEELQAEIRSLRQKIGDFQDRNGALASDVQRARADRAGELEALEVLEAKLAGVEEQKRELESGVGRQKSSAQEREREIQRLERRLDGLLKNNQMLQGILAMREKAALVSNEEIKEKEKAFKEAQQLEAEMRDSLQVSARQLSFMKERAELLNEKLQERDQQLMAVQSECAKKDEVILSLEQRLGDLAKSLDAQNRQIVLLSSRNGDLTRYLEAQGQDVKDLHSRFAADSQKRANSLPEMDKKSAQQELDSQNLLCKLLRDKLSQRENDLTKRSEEVSDLERSREWLQSELQRAQKSISEASQRLASLERIIRQKEEALVEKDGHLRDLSSLRELLPRVEHERDEVQREAEEIGREALRLSAEVEVLRRKVAQLEENVMVKEGQISILRGTSFAGNVSHPFQNLSNLSIHVEGNSSPPLGIRESQMIRACWNSLPKDSPCKSSTPSKETDVIIAWAL